MKKIIVIGCPGSGKTTFAKRLHEMTDIEIFHLDAIWHKADKTHISRDEFDLRLGDILALDSWIVDGNYTRTIRRRIEAADTVILFDLPTEVCLDGANARLGVQRTDMPWFEIELDPEFKAEIERFRSDILPRIYEVIDEYKDDKKTVIFKSREEAESFLSELKCD